ncbi:hypothetical protein [Rhodococcoides corynebacterioides]|uniref:hypothetical protein n=1 Tax=Rhodococcoides corynebacterioides TaxID=53972 RepID=UPI001C9BA771|nr:hypothetical protein [Rhodococcus corynebacterioides]MBY6349829.1 hypothetical protein [Rhodococcus corynebacterioides]
MIFLIALAVFGLMFGVILVRVMQPPSATEEERLRKRVVEADQQVHAQYLAARREMNKAAGQSWRNLIE